MLLPGRDKSGSPETILPYGNDIAGKTCRSHGLLERFMPSTSLLQRAVLSQGRFQKYDDDIHVLDIQPSNLIDRYSLTYHSRFRSRLR